MFRDFSDSKDGIERDNGMTTVDHRTEFLVDHSGVSVFRKVNNDR